MIVAWHRGARLGGARLGKAGYARQIHCRLVRGGNSRLVLPATLTLAAGVRPRGGQRGVSLRARRRPNFATEPVVRYDDTVFEVRAV
jgi:hypothetical protein